MFIRKLTIAYAIDMYSVCRYSIKIALRCIYNTVCKWTTFTYGLGNVGHQYPSLKYLNRHVKKPVGSKWYDLGIDLLEKDDVKELNTIRSQYPADLNTICKEMFQLWLRKQPTASWNQLLDSLRQPGIDLDNLASEIEQMLLPTGVYVVVCIVHVCICHISLLN